MFSQLHVSLLASSLSFLAQGPSQGPFCFARSYALSASVFVDSRGALLVQEGPVTVELSGRVVLDYGMSLNGAAQLDPVVSLSGNVWAANVSGSPFFAVRLGDPLTYPATGQVSGGAIVQSGRALVWQGMPAPPHLSNGGTYVHFPAYSKSDRYAVMMVRIMNNQVVERSGVLRIRTDGAGDLLEQSLVLEDGAWIPALGASVTAWSPAVSPDGRVLASVGFMVGGVNMGALWLDGQIVIRDGDSLSNSTLRIVQVLPGGSSAGDVNASGSWMCFARLTNGALGVVKDGSLLFDASQPGFDTGGVPISRLERGSITEDGRVIWVAEAGSPGFGPVQRWILLDGLPVYRPGIDRFEGAVVGDPSGYSSRVVDPEGAFATFSAELDPAPPLTSWRGFELPLVRSQQVCDGPQTSFGTDPTIEYLGSTYVDSEKRYLVARGLPPNATLLWLQSTQPGSFPLPAVGQGTICLGSPIARRPATTDAQGTVMGPAALMGQPGR